MEFGWVLLGSFVTIVTWVVLLSFGSTDVLANTMISLVVTLIVGGLLLSVFVNARRGKTK